MTFSYSHRRSAVLGKAPQPADIEEGEIAINTETPELYTKDARGNIIGIVKSKKEITLNVDRTTGIAAPLSAIDGDPFDTVKGCLEWLMEHRNAHTERVTINIAPGTYSEGEVIVKQVKCRVEIQPSTTGAVTLNTQLFKLRDCSDIQFTNMTVNCTKFQTQKNTIFTLNGNVRINCSDKLEIDYPSAVVGVGNVPIIETTNKMLIGGALISKSGAFRLLRKGSTSTDTIMELSGVIGIDFQGTTYGQIRMPGARVIEYHEGAVFPSSPDFFIDGPTFTCINRGRMAPLSLLSIYDANKVMLDVTGAIEVNRQRLRPYVSLTQTAYDALTPPDPDTLYVITGP